MATIELSGQETNLLQMILQSRLSMLLVELNHTDTREFREELKRQMAQVEGLLEKVPSETEARRTA